MCKCFAVNTLANQRMAGFWATVCETVRPMLSDRCPVCLSVCDVGVLWPNGWTDQDETWQGGRRRPRPHCVRWGPSSPEKRAQPSNFRPISVVAKRLDESKCHLVGRQTSAQATLCSPLYGKWHSNPPLFDPCLLWPNSHPFQQLLSSCTTRKVITRGRTDRQLVG